MFSREHNTFGILGSQDSLQGKLRVKQTCLPFKLNTLPGKAVIYQSINFVINYRQLFQCNNHYYSPAPRRVFATVCSVLGVQQLSLL